MNSPEVPPFPELPDAEPLDSEQRDTEPAAIEIPEEAIVVASQARPQRPRINVALGEQRTDMIWHVMRQEGYTITEAVRLLLRAGVAVDQAIEKGDGIFIRDNETGAERQIMIITT